MKATYLLTFFALFLLGACSKEETTSNDTVQAQIQQLSQALTESEKNNNLESFPANYDANAISMPEYQPTLQGKNEIEAFYKEIFQRQQIKTFERKADEIIDLGKTIIEIGTFKKAYTDLKTDSLFTQNGKYWNVWGLQPDGNFTLKGESFGFFHPVEKPEALIVELNKKQAGESELPLDQEIPFELKAYNALMEKGVRERDGILRSEFFTSDATFMPFADSTRTGISQLKPYMVAYNSGQVNIDSISVYTYHHENFDDKVLEYAKFKVKFTVPDFLGKIEGKGIRIWKRQADNSLKIYREIGTHNHIL